MRRRVWIVCILVAGMLSISALALPDLVISDITLQPSNPEAGQLVHIEVAVSNYGDSPVEEPFFVRFMMDGREIAVRPLTDRIAPGDSRHVSTDWTAIAGPHSLVVEADPSPGRVAESNEENNSAPRTFSTSLDEKAESAIRGLKLVVAPFADLTSSGFLHVGQGVADMLTDRLEGIGARVLEGSEFEAILQENDLDPTRLADVAQAGRLLGADLVLLGSMTSLDVASSKLQLGFLSVTGADATCKTSVQIVNTYTSQVMDVVSGEGHDDGATGFSVDLSGFLALFGIESSDLCSGGVQTARAWYNIGESIPIAYHNPGASEWIGIEIRNAVGSFVRWLGWQYVAADTCGIWYWDQLGSSGEQMNTGFYTAKVLVGTSYVGEQKLQIRPGISLSVPPVGEITVGTPQFQNTVVGSALGLAVDDLTAGLLQSLENVSLGVEEQRSATASAEPLVNPIEGQIASVLPDGRVAINIGASSGVTVGDVFEIVQATHVVIDRQSLRILSYDAWGVKGEIVITEVRDRASTGVPTTEFEPAVGDVVRTPQS